MRTTEIIESARAELTARGERPTTTRIMASARRNGFVLTPHEIKNPMRDRALEASASGAALECAGTDGSFPSTLTEAGSLMWMPSGTFEITPSQGGRPCPVTVLVDSDSAAAIEQQRQILASKGKNMFFSESHTSEKAIFWPSKFTWDTRIDCTGTPATGVWADGTWTASGIAARDGHSYRSFSPVFHVDNTQNVPCQVICEPNARANGGACENDAAFASAMSPLWAKSAGSPAQPSDAEQEHRCLMGAGVFADAFDEAMAAHSRADASLGSANNYYEVSALSKLEELAWKNVAAMALRNGFYRAGQSYRESELLAKNASEVWKELALNRR